MQCTIQETPKTFNPSYPVNQVAPVTSSHILKLAKLGAYNTVNFFRVDKGFVAQTADVVFGRLEGVGLDARQQAGLSSPHFNARLQSHPFKYLCVSVAHITSEHFHLCGY